MKKIIYISLGIICFIFLVVFAARLLLPYGTVYILEKAINGRAQLEKIDISFEDKVLKVDISGIRLEGDIDGSIGSIHVSYDIKRGLYLNNLTMSDFHLSVKKKKEDKIRFLKIPAGLVLIKKGIIQYDSYKIIINEIVVKNLVYKKPFTFQLDIQSDYYFHTILAKGEGVYRRRGFELKGNADISGLRGDLWTSHIKGHINGKCNFNYEKDKLTINGPVEAIDFSLNAGFLLKPLFLKKVNGNISLTYHNKSVHVFISGVKFKGSPFDLQIKTDLEGLEMIMVKSGYINMEDIKSNLYLKNISKEANNAMDYIQYGWVRLNRLLYSRTSPFLCDLDIKDVGLLYDDMEIKNINGHLIIDETKAKFDNFYGLFKRSRFHNINGQLDFAGSKGIKVKGNFYVNLLDIPTKVDLGNLKFKNGFSEGIFEFEKREGEKEYNLKGNGRLIKSEVLFNDFPVHAKGFYRFNRDEIEFDPLEIEKGQSSLKIRGRWRKGLLGIRIMGRLDIQHIYPFVKIPFKARGTTELDMEIKKKDSDIHISGFVNMDDLYYKIEKFLSKNRGIRNTVSLTILRKNGVIEINHFDYNLEGINLRLKGKIEKDVARDVHLTLKVPEIEKTDHIFLLIDTSVKGNIAMDIMAKELFFSFKKVPLIYGTIEIKNGYIKLPDIPSPLSEINLTSKFDGDEIHIKSNGIKCGNSVFNSMELRSKGIENPNFALSIDIDNFNYSDFETPGDIVIYSIRPDNILAKAKGEAHITAKSARIGNKIGSNVLMKVVYGDRKLNLSEIKANALDGYVEGHGVIDISGTVPMISLTGKMNGISSGEFLRMFGAKTHVIESKEFIFMDINFYGNTIKDFTKTLSGKATIYSENGVIKKMNLLSKIFGLLNVYELLRGRVDLTTSGFKYNKTSANFAINNGIFRSDDYIIDSPSMVITGQGSLNLVDETMEARITVSPLVTIDKVISNIPILKNMLKDKKRGFIYAVYDVNGPIDDPDIKTGYIHTIGSLPLNILRGMIEFPMNLFRNNSAK